MPRVYVKNENKHVLSQYYKGEQVTIESGDFWRNKKGEPIAMDICEANEFKGAYLPCPLDTDGKRLDDPKYYKILSFQPILDDEEVREVAQSTAKRCMHKSCKHVAASDEKLSEHTDTAHPGTETLILPDEDVKLTRKKKAA